MLEYAKNHKDFRLPVSEPKIGKVNDLNLQMPISPYKQKKTEGKNTCICVCKIKKKMFHPISITDVSKYSHISKYIHVVWTHFLFFLYISTSIFLHTG